MKKLVASIVVIAFFATGCTGPFELTHKVYNWQTSQSDKWSDELCFLLVTLIPIYSIAMLADAIVFNSIEFWTGKNPVETSYVPPQSHLAMKYDAKTDEVRVSLANNHGFIVQRTATGIIAKNDKGQVLYSAVQNTNGDVTVYDSNGKLVKNYPAGQIALLKEKYMQQ
jgi:Domain of unknown function (DUF3332)